MMACARMSLIAFFVLVAPALAQIFVPTWGFEDDVDILVAPNGEFMLVPEESEDGSQARLRIIDLDPVTGEPIALLFETEVNVHGFENGVDAMIIWMEGAAEGFLILVPVESEDGKHAGLIQIRTDNLGGFVDRRDIDLGDLGYREDVDGIWNAYTGSIAFFPLESEDRSVRGILAIDVSDAGDGDWGSCLLLSTDGRAGCEDNRKAEGLPGLADGMDPVAFEMGDRLRLALPVASPDGSDLLFVDFDSDDVAGDLPPVHLEPIISVKAVNAGGPRPLEFPGYEWDVDIVHLEPGQCEVGRSLIIPVEGAGDVADLYKIDQWGTALWVFSMDGGDPSVRIDGYEAGVDLLVMCGLVGFDPPNRLAVPVENAAGTDADLYIVNAENLQLLARVEDPTLNPGLTIPGYEIGVDLVPWRPGAFVAPVEGSGGPPGLLSLRPDGMLHDAISDPTFLGYMRSVDPIVAPLEPPALVVPIGKDDGTDADIVVFTLPPHLVAGYSLELENPGLGLSRCEWDLDLGLVDKTEPGELHLCLAEETFGGGLARLRFEVTAGLPGDRVLALATAASGALPATLYLVDVPTGNILVAKDDLLGLETGLDMVTGSGPATPGPVPVFPRPTAVDRDGDPTLGWIFDPSGIPGDVPTAAPARLIPIRHANPFTPSSTIEYELPEKGDVNVDIIDVGGRIVRRIRRGAQAAGVQSVVWDGRNERGIPVASGVYFVEVRVKNSAGTSKLVLVR